MVGAWLSLSRGGVFILLYLSVSAAVRMRVGTMALLLIWSQTGYTLVAMTLVVLVVDYE